MEQEKFTFQGVQGCVDKFGFVMWSGMGFHMDAIKSSALWAEVQTAFEKHATNKEVAQ